MLRNTHTHSETHVHDLMNQPIMSVYKLVKLCGFHRGFILRPKGCWQASVHFNSGHTSARLMWSKRFLEISFSKDAQGELS